MSDWDGVDILEAMGHDPVDPPHDALRVVNAIERARAASGYIVEDRAVADAANAWIEELGIDCRRVLIAQPGSHHRSAWKSGLSQVEALAWAARYRRVKERK